jgi:hypothetical protein
MKNDELKNENSTETKPFLDKACPNCKTELSTGYISDARAGKHFFDVIIYFCEECLYIGDADCTNISR